jgi:hypothetical protein
MTSKNPTFFVGKAPKAYEIASPEYVYNVLKNFKTKESKKCYLTEEKNKELILAIPRMLKEREVQNVKEIYKKMLEFLSVQIATNESVDIGNGIVFYNDYTKNRYLKSLSKKLFFLINRTRANG